MAKFELAVIINGCKVYSHSKDFPMIDVVENGLKKGLIDEVDKMMDTLLDRGKKMEDEYIAKYIDKWKKECENQQ